METSIGQLIVAVVPKTMVERVKLAAMHAGATGATHWKGHGTGVEYETFLDAVFRFPPEREIVTVVAPAEIADQVFAAVAASAPLDVPGIGFAVSIDLAHVAGIRNVAPA